MTIIKYKHFSMCCVCRECGDIQMKNFTKTALVIGSLAIVTTAFSVYFAGFQSARNLALMEPAAGTEEQLAAADFCFAPMVTLTNATQFNLTEAEAKLPTADKFVTYAQKAAHNMKSDVRIEKLNYLDRYAFIMVSTPQSKGYFMFDNVAETGCEISAESYGSVIKPRDDVRQAMAIEQYVQ